MGSQGLSTPALCSLHLQLTQRLQPVGKHFCSFSIGFFGVVFFLLLMFKRGGEGRERMTIAQEDQLGSGPGAAQ